MRRISTAMVKKAYAEMGVNPMVDNWRWCNEDKTRACGLGVLGLKAGKDNGEVYAWARQRFGVGYTLGFARGFDGYTKARADRSLNMYLRAQPRAMRNAWVGFADGHRVRRALGL